MVVNLRVSLLGLRMQVDYLLRPTAVKSSLCYLQGNSALALQVQLVFAGTLTLSSRHKH